MIRVRNALPTDVAAICGLFNAGIPSTTGMWRDHLASVEEMEEWFAQRQAACDPVLVAQVDDDVVGYTASAAFRGGPRFPGYSGTVEITIHVAEDEHGRGIGRALLSVLAEDARHRGLHVLVAAIDGENESSIRFHEALGFAHVGRMPEVGRKFDRWLDLVLMQRILD